MHINSLPILSVVLTTLALSPALRADDAAVHHGDERNVQLGPRPFYLVDGMDDGPLKERLGQCKNGPFRTTDFSIGHRGAGLEIPEHTRESYDAAARMGPASWSAT